MPRHLLKLRKLHAPNLPEQHTAHLLKEIDDVVLVDKAHLAVHLREFRLAVGAQIFVAETFHYLEITVETGHHKQLLERLRTLWERIELSGIHTAWHYEIACTLGSRTNQERRLYLNELLSIKEIADKNSHAMTQLQVLPHYGTPKVQVAILHSQVIASVSIVLDCEWRSERRTQHIKLRSNDFDVTGRHLGVLTLPLTDLTLHLDAIFTSKTIGGITECLICRFVENQLRDTIAVAQIDEGHASHLTRALHPSGKDDLLATVGEPQLPASISPIHYILVHLFYQAQYYGKSI